MIPGCIPTGLYLKSHEQRSLLTKESETVHQTQSDPLALRCPMLTWQPGQRLAQFLLITDQYSISFTGRI